MMPSTSGLFLSIITETGQFMYIMESHFAGSNVTNCVIINEDEVLCSIQDDEVCKLVILHLDTKEEKIVIQPEREIYFLDIVAIPGISSFFVMHTGRGIHLIDADHQKTYDLCHNEQNNFNVCRSLSVQQIDQEDPEQGFWIAQIDNGTAHQMQVKSFDFKSNFIQALKNLHSKTQ